MSRKAGVCDIKVGKLDLSLFLFYNPPEIKQEDYMKLSELERGKDKLLRKIQDIGDMRSGSLSVRYQRCSKSPCVCDDPRHPGHGPIYSFSTIIDGKTKIKNYKLGPELDKLRKEIENYQTFKELSQDLIAISNQLCDLRPVTEVKDETELEELKKKLKRVFMRRYKKK